MPIYAYRCAHCGHAKDLLRKISDPVLTVCLACGADAFQKQVTAAGFQLKGSGWYVTDFRGDNKAAKNDKSDKSEKGGDADRPSGGDAKADGGAPAAAPAPAAAGAPPATPAPAPASAPAASTSTPPAASSGSGSGSK